MNKTKLIELIKDEIHLCADELTEENILDISENIKSQLSVLSAIEKATFITKSNSKEQLIESDKLQDVHETIQQEPIESVNADKTVITGFFQQKLRGGLIHEKEQIYIPEKFIRELGLESGDLVQATFQGYNYSSTLLNNKKPEYYFEVLEKNKKQQQEEVRKVQPMLTIKNNDELNSLSVEFRDSASEMIVTALISQHDKTRFNLEAGDIIDFAYEPNNPGNGKVIWKHKITEIQNMYESTNKKIKSNSKESASDDEADSDIEPVFEGLSILTVGGTAVNLHRTAQEEVTKRKGEFNFLSGEEPKESMISKIKKADIVVVFTESISHDAMNLTKEVCKKHNKVVSFMKNTGGSSLVLKLSMMKDNLLQEI